MLAERIALVRLHGAAEPAAGPAIAGAVVALSCMVGGAHRQVTRGGATHARKRLRPALFQDLSTPEALAVWVAMISISSGDRQS